MSQLLAWTVYWTVAGVLSFAAFVIVMCAFDGAIPFGRTSKAIVIATAVWLSPVVIRAFLMVVVA